MNCCKCGKELKEEKEDFFKIEEGFVCENCFYYKWDNQDC